MLSKFATIIASFATIIASNASNDPFLLNIYVIGKNKEVKTMHEL